MKWKPGELCPLSRSPTLVEEGKIYLGGMTAFCPCVQGPCELLTKSCIPYPCFLPPCRLTLLQTPTHFWSLSTLRVVGSRERGEKPILSLLRWREQTNRDSESVYMGRTFLEEDSKKVEYRNSIPCHKLSFSPLKQGALEIPVSAKPSTGVQPPKGWS